MEVTSIPMPTSCNLPNCNLTSRKLWAGCKAEGLCLQEIPKQGLSFLNVFLLSSICYNLRTLLRSWTLHMTFACQTKMPMHLMVKFTVFEAHCISMLLQIIQEILPNGGSRCSHSFTTTGGHKFRKILRFTLITVQREAWSPELFQAKRRATLPAKCGKKLRQTSPKNDREPNNALSERTVNSFRSIRLANDSLLWHYESH